MTRIDLNRVWDDAKAMGVANKDLLAAISGMFVLLPSVVGGLLAKEPANTAKNVPVEEAYRQLMQFYSDNWPIFVAVLLAVSFGLLAMLALLLRPERLTVGESLKAAIVLLPGYLVASLIQGFGMGLGFLLFVVPGLYVLARLSLIAPVAAAEQCANPLEQLRRSLVLTRGQWLAHSADAAGSLLHCGDREHRGDYPRRPRRRGAAPQGYRGALRQHHQRPGGRRPDGLSRAPVRRDLSGRDAARADALADRRRALTPSSRSLWAAGSSGSHRYCRRS